MQEIEVVWKGWGSGSGCVVEGCHVFITDTTTITGMKT